MINIPIDGREKVRANGKHSITNEAYHLDKHYFSSSQVKTALTSPAHFRYYSMERNAKHEPTAAMELGTLIHLLVLEPQLFDDTYVVFSGEPNKDGSVPKASLKLLNESHPGRTPVSKKNYDIAVKVRQSFMAYPEAKALMFDDACEYEESFYVDCPETGLKLRVRPDIINLTDNIIIDLKTTSTTGKDEFLRDAKYRYHYDLSAYMYSYVVFQLTGVECEFYFSVVGKEDLTPIALYKASRAFMESGKDKFFRACDNIKKALELPDDYRYQESIEEI